MELTSVELFTGGGGPAEAMHDAGFKHLLVSEIDARACQTLRMNRSTDVDSSTPELPVARQLADKGYWPLTEGDVHKLDLSTWTGAIDVVAGGVPCQPWSLGGAHKGYEDPRNLWPEFSRIVAETRPKAFIAENVRGLLRPSFSEYWSYTLDTLRHPHVRRRDGEDWRDHAQRLALESSARSTILDEEYDVSVHPVNAANYGVPQVRNRVFTIGVRRDLRKQWSFPKATHSEAALKRAQLLGDYWESHGLRPSAVINTPETIPYDGLLPWRTLRDAIAGLPEPLGDKIEHPDFLHHYGWPGARQYPGHGPNALDRPAKTIKAGVHGVPGGETVILKDDGSLRYMTVREVARVMTFPDRWKLAGPRGEQMRQLGNAVPVDLGGAMASSLASLLRSVEK